MFGAGLQTPPLPRPKVSLRCSRPGVNKETFGPSDGEVGRPRHNRCPVNRPRSPNKYCPDLEHRGKPGRLHRKCEFYPSHSSQDPGFAGSPRNYCRSSSSEGDRQRSPREAGQPAEAEGVAMRWFRSMGAIGLCLGLAGCAGTQQRLVFGPGNTPGARTAAAHSSCGCGPAQRPMLPSANPSPPVTALASRPPVPPPLPSARFFPLLGEQDVAPADPLENPRADWLGVRTVQGVEGRATPILRDGAMDRASTEEPLPPVLPLVLKIADPRDVPEGAGRRPRRCSRLRSRPR